MQVEERTEFLKRMERRIRQHATYDKRRGFWKTLKLCLKIAWEERKAMKTQQELANTKQNLN